MSQKPSEQQVTLYNTKHKDNRDIDVFTGICIGMLCDGHVNIDELNYLHEWLIQHNNIANKYPASSISKNIGRWVADGKIDEAEEIELLKILTAIASGSTDNDDLFCSPEPEIFINGARISFTGDSEFSRDDLEGLVTSLGATVARKEVSSTTDFLVVAGSGSANWKNISGGTKITKATEIKNNGGKIKIVREEYFLRKLKELIDA